MIKLFLRVVTTIAVTFCLLFSTCFANDQNTNNYYERGISLASHLKSQNIGDQKFSLKYVYDGLKNKLENKPTKKFTDEEKNKTSLVIGYITGQNHLKDGTLFAFKPKNLKYDPTIVLKGILDHYTNIKPQYELIPRNILLEAGQNKPDNISDSAYCYNLGYSIFEIPKNYLKSNFIDESAFLDGMKAGLHNEKLSLSEKDIDEVSYIMGYLLYTNDNKNLKNMTDKNSFLKGFHSEIHNNVSKEPSSDL